MDTALAFGILMFLRFLVPLALLLVVGMLIERFGNQPTGNL